MAWYKINDRVTRVTCTSACMCTRNDATVSGSLTVWQFVLLERRKSCMHACEVSIRYQSSLAPLKYVASYR